MEESKIDDLFNDSNTVYFFDVDGVLAPICYGKYNHYYYDDEAWSKFVLENDGYANVLPIKKMQMFINKRDKNLIYVITKVMNDKELEEKVRFLVKNYNIIPSHIYGVCSNNDKLMVMKKIRKEYANLDDKNFVLIDDTVDVLNYVMENSSFATVHISSFL